MRIAFQHFQTSRVEKNDGGPYDLRLMDTENVKRYFLVEIALLVIFLIGLLIAHVIVKAHNRPPQILADSRDLIDVFLQTRSQQFLPADEAFQITGTTGQNRGYYYARHSLSEDNDQRRYNIQTWRVQYNSSKLKSELWLDPMEKEYRWEIVDLRSRRGVVYEIAPDANGMLLVKQNGKEIKTFPAHEFLLPEPLLIDFAHVFLQSQYTEVVFDILTSQGQLDSVHLQKLPPGEALLKFKSVDAVVRIDFPRHPKSFEELYFDAAGNLLRKYDHPGLIWQVVPAGLLQEILQKDFQIPEDITVQDT